jgi:aminoglycoside phosphotransferase (APT) family kinase protein
MNTTATDLARGAAGEMLTYLRHQLGVTDLRYRQPLTILPDGWETRTYRFQLESARSLPTAFAEPLVLRVYGNREALPRLRHEFLVQEHLSWRGYPAPKPLLLEEGGWPMPGPFLVMQWIAGQSLLQYLLDHPMSIWSLPKDMAELQARLNQMPVQDFPAAARPHLPRSLQWLAQVVQECGFEVMVPGLDWLEAHQPPPPTAPCIVHLDFHPLNLLVDETGFRTVLDWSDADVGDYHADVASTLLLVDTAPIKLTRWRDWLASLPGKGIMRRRYLRKYRSCMPLDPERLRYYLAWAAFRRLAMWGRWLHLGPQGAGVKPTTASQLTPGRLRFLARYFEKHSGVAIGLPRCVGELCGRRLPGKLGVSSPF